MFKNYVFLYLYFFLVLIFIYKQMVKKEWYRQLRKKAYMRVRTNYPANIKIEERK